MQDIGEDIIIRASEGDVGSFEKIYRAYSGFVYNVSLRIARSHRDAEEVTQNVFLILYRKLKSFRFRSSLKTWIYRIAVNLAINHAKKVSKERDRVVEYDDSIGIEPSRDVIGENLDREQKEKTIARLLGALNPDQRACIVLRNINGLSYEEIAQTLNININTVRTRLKRARERLLTLRREVMADEL
ncbi:MAG: RNA polymerase sigma factor [Candidatus Omnitrophota bacterium]